MTITYCITYILLPLRKLFSIYTYNINSSWRIIYSLIIRVGFARIIKLKSKHNTYQTNNIICTYPKYAQYDLRFNDQVINYWCLYNIHMAVLKIGAEISMKKCMKLYYNKLLLIIIHIIHVLYNSIYHE